MALQFAHGSNVVRGPLSKYGACLNLSYVRDACALFVAFLSLLILSVVMIPFFPRMRRATTDPMSMRVASTNMNNPARLFCIGAVGWAVLISTMMVSCECGVPEVVPHMSVQYYQEGLMSVYSDVCSRVFTTLTQNHADYLGTSTRDNDKLYDLYYHDYYRDIHLLATRRTC